MKAELRGLLIFLASCACAVWGAFLNDVVTMWLWRTQGYDWLKMTPYVPIIPIFLGLVMGFFTAIALLCHRAKLRNYGFAFLALTLLFCVPELNDKGWLLSFDNYALSFLWALSLIAIGTLRAPKNEVS